MTLSQWAPGIDQFRGYRRIWLRGDVVAGVTVAAYLVPQVMAYATVAGLSPVVGLWAALLPLAFYAVLGSSRQLSAGPESTTALMTASALAPLAVGDPGRYATLAAALGLLVGIMCFLGGVLRLGFLADLLSRPVLVGYMSGVAIIMIASQLGKVSGVAVKGEEFVALVRSFASELHQVHWPTVALSAAVLAALVLLAWRLPRTGTADRDVGRDRGCQCVVVGPQWDSGDRPDPEWSACAGRDRYPVLRPDGSARPRRRHRDRRILR